MDDYTPDTATVAVAYRLSEMFPPDVDSKPHDPLEMAEVDAEFQRWLAAHDRAVAANAWDEGYGQGVRDNERDMEPADNPYRITEENN